MSQKETVTHQNWTETLWKHSETQTKCLQEPKNSPVAYNWILLTPPPPSPPWKKIIPLGPWAVGPLMVTVKLKNVLILHIIVAPLALRLPCSHDTIAKRSVLWPQLNKKRTLVRVSLNITVIEEHILRDRQHFLSKTPRHSIWWNHCHISSHSIAKILQ